MKMMLNNPGPTEGAALTLRQLLGAPCPKMPKLGETVSQEMEVAIIAWSTGWVSSVCRAAEVPQLL